MLISVFLLTVKRARNAVPSRYSELVSHLIFLSELFLSSWPEEGEKRGAADRQRVADLCFQVTRSQVHVCLISASPGVTVASET